jgi:molecular chaperone GrpE
MTRDDEAPENGENGVDEDIVMVEPPTETLEELLAQEEAEAEARARAGDSAEGSESSSSDEVTKSRAEIAELRDRHLRKLAEFDNIRKRTEKEKAEYYRFALSEFVRDLLPVLDNFERALGHGPESNSDDYRQGVQLIAQQLADALRKRGVTEVDVSGPFDPNLHEAVAREETVSVPPNTILEVLQKGYYLNDRLIRPAFVKVAASPASGENPEES